MSNTTDDLEEIPEMDLVGGVRGKYYDRYMQGTNVVLLEPDVARVFRGPASVNQALREHISEHPERAPAADADHGKRSPETPYRIEVAETFWESLRNLEDTPATALALAALLERLSCAPDAATLLSGTHVWTATTPETSMGPLRVVYVFDEESKTVELLAVQTASDHTEQPSRLEEEVKRVISQYT